MAEYPDEGEKVRISKEWAKPSSELDDSTDRMMNLLDRKLEQFKEEEIVDIPVKRLELEKL